MISRTKPGKRSKLNGKELITRAAATVRTAVGEALKAKAAKRKKIREDMNCREEHNIGDDMS